jgi:type II secretory pathway pseudopilin PulG
MRLVRRSEGFGLVELLVAMTMAVIVFGATLTILDVFVRQTQRRTQRDDAADRARVGVDRIVRQLRNIASPVTSPKLLERATLYDMVFQTIGTPSGSNATGAERVRYCLPADTSAGDPTKEVMYGQVQNWSTAAPPASPWTSDPTVTIACPDPNYSIAYVVSRVNNGAAVTNRYQGRTDRPAFCYNSVCSPPSDLTKVTSVQIDLFVNPTPPFAPAQTELRSAAYLRNQVHAPVAQFTATDQGGGEVLLNGAISYSPDGEDLSYSWACTSSGCPSGLAGATDGLVDWHPGPGTYTIVLTVTDATGLIGTSDPQSITVT